MKSKLQIATLVIAVLGVITFASCGDDDGPGIPSELLGTWDVTRAESSDCADPDDNGVEEFACNATECLSIEFRADGTLTSIELFEGDLDSEPGIYTVNGNELTVTISSDVTRTTFSVSGNTLTIVSTEGGCTGTTTLIRRQ